MPDKRRRSASRGPAPPAEQCAIEVDGRVMLSRALSAEAVRAYAVAAGFHAQRDGRSKKPLLEESLAGLLEWSKADARSAIEELADASVVESDGLRAVVLQTVRGDAIRRLDPTSSTVRCVTVDLRPFHARRLSAESAWAYGAVAIGTSALGRGEVLHLADAMQLLGEDDEEAVREWLGTLPAMRIIDMDQDADDPPIRLAELPDDVVVDLRVAEFTCEELGRTLLSQTGDSAQSRKLHQARRAECARRAASRKAR